MALYDIHVIDTEEDCVVDWASNLTYAEMYDVEEEMAKTWYGNRYRIDVTRKE